MASLFFVFMKGNIRELILKTATPIVKSLNLEIWGLETLEMARTVVRLFVEPIQEKGIQILSSDRLHTVQSSSANKKLATFDLSQKANYSASIDQCEEVSRRLGLSLDAEDIFDNAWVLEVSTPGLERRFFTLDQMRPYTNDLVKVILSAPLPDFDSDTTERKVFRGKLVFVGDNDFTLDLCCLAADGSLLSENMPLCVIPWSLVHKISRIHIFDANKGKPRGKKRKVQT